MTEQNITQQDLNKNWVEEELNEMPASEESVFEKLPALKLEENKIVEVTVDLSNKFQSYHTTDMKGQPVTKAIIPILHDGEKKNWWLNKKNPIYRQILEKGKGKDTLIIKVIQTGNQANTKYAIVE